MSIQMLHPPLTAPHLRTELPGPKAKEIIEADERFVSTSYTRAYPLVVSRGQGAVVEDVDGNRFLDFTAGIAVCATGHCHPRVVAAIQRQAERLLHMCGADFYYEPLRDLAEKLTAITPGGFAKRVFFTNSGAESIEAAMKLARYATGRKHYVAFSGAFHGRTMGALSLTASKVRQQKRFGPLVPDVTHVRFDMDAIRTLERQIFTKQVSPDEVAAIIVEPIQGEGGYLVPPDEFHPQLKALAERHGILYVVDEIQSGMGRTGKMFAIEHWGVEPDIVCIAKGLASGMPLGAIIARAEIMNWEPGAHASTFGGNPVSCVAAMATIALLEEGLMANAAEVGGYLLERLRDWRRTHPLVADVRGKGLMIGIELGRPGLDPSSSAKLREDILQRCFYQGLVLLGCGETAIRLCPPLVITKSEADTAMRILGTALAEVESGLAKGPH
jgi:4-aminobutyrate aminotransferase